MYHNRSLLPDVEVLLDVLVKTSRYSTKLLFVILNFYSREEKKQYCPNVKKLTKFTNFNKNSEFWLEFIIPTNFKISAKFYNFNQISDFQPKPICVKAE